MSSRIRLVAKLTLERWALTTRLRLQLWHMRAQIWWGLVHIACTRVYIRWLIRRHKLPPNSLRVLDQQARYLHALEQQKTDPVRHAGNHEPT